LRTQQIKQAVNLISQDYHYPAGIDTDAF